MKNELTESHEETLEKEFYTPAEIEHVLGVKARTLRSHRTNGTGPAYSRPSYKVVAYRLDDVRDFFFPELQARDQEE